MKKFTKILLGILATFLAISCNNGIDDITFVAPGADVTAPMIKVNYPAEGAVIKLFEEVSPIDIDFEVTDDIEISKISVLLDGTEIKNYNDFIDYRRALEKFTYDSLRNGDHILSVIATDNDGKTTTLEVKFTKEPGYTQMFDGEKLYMPFDGDYMNLLKYDFAAKVGDPGFAGTSYAGLNAYKGAEDSYITYPTDGLMGAEFSAVFWYKVDATPDRAGILVAGADENRTQGFRLFREGSSTEQRIKLNVGTGDGESWNDGGVIDATTGDWVNVAVTISQTQSTIYFNGIKVNTADLASPIDWTGVSEMVIGASGPTFSYWDHKSDYSDIDELRVFDKALTQSDIQIIINSFNPYISAFPGETFYMPFDNAFINLVGGGMAAGEVGTPTITGNSKDGDGAYLGATDSYLTYPTDGLMSNQFSGAFWYKVDTNPDRAGIIVAGADENRTQGFRLFREGDGASQRIKLNVGTGTDESWNDGGVIDVAAGEWVHVTFTISDTESKIYFNGIEVNTASLVAPIDWTGVSEMDICAGGPTFSYWNHLSDNSSMDELRFFDHALTPEEIQSLLAGATFGYMPKYDGEMFYMPFDGNDKELISKTDATVVGTPGFAGESVIGSDAYAGATGSYLTYPTDGLTTTEFSATMWYKLNNTPDRAGILVMGPEDVNNAGYPGVQNLRTNGFRFFREDNGSGLQRFKLNVGDGTADTWVDGGAAADVDPTTGNWIHLAFTISGTDASVYIDGQLVAQASISGVDWTGCDLLSIMSGAQRFTEWGHLSDNSYLDDLRLYNKALSQTEIQTVMNGN